MSDLFARVLAGKARWPRIVGCSQCKCDATTEPGKQYIVDFAFPGEPVKFYLSVGALRALLTFTLTPLAWLRLATRMGPDHMLLDEDHYTRLGLALTLQSCRGSAEFTATAWKSFLLDALAESPGLIVAFGIVGEEEDVLQCHALPPIAKWIRGHGQDRILESVDEYSVRPRQVEEILSRLDAFVSRFIQYPPSIWLKQRWALHGPACFTSLVRLSLQTIPWSEVLPLARGALGRMSRGDRTGNALGWGLLVESAPPELQSQLQSEYLKLVPADQRHLALRYMSPW